MKEVEQVNKEGNKDSGTSSTKPLLSIAIDPFLDIPEPGTEVIYRKRKSKIVIGDAHITPKKILPTWYGM